MLELFSRLIIMLETSVFIALIASFVWGVLSIVLSPCHLAGVPLIMGHIAVNSDGTKKKAGVMALLFALGILITLLVIGIVTILIGRIAGDIGSWVTYTVGGFLIFFGLYLTDIFPFDLFNFTVNPSINKQGFLPSFLFGLVFGLALGPCTFAFMAPMLAIGFQTARTDPVFAFSLFGMFVLGHCVVIIAAGLLTETVRSVLRWNEKTGGMEKVKHIFGWIITAAGGYLIVQQLLR